MIKGIEQNSQASKILFDKLRNLKKATHKNLAKMIEYNWDDNEQAYCIIFQFIQANTLENKLYSLKPTVLLKVIENSVSCLKELNQTYRITYCRHSYFSWRHCAFCSNRRTQCFLLLHFKELQNDVLDSRKPLVLLL